jgi:putative membrane protein
MRFPHFLFAIYVALFVVCAIEPYSRAVWIAENTPIVAIALALAFTYRYFQFSNLAYALMAVLLLMHTVGGHYTFERVPVGIWAQNGFGLARNHYDRVAHFSVGFYAFAMAELLVRTKATTQRWIVYVFPLATIMAVACGYELIEWIYAELGDPNAGAAFLGSQGDIWDAQKDMLADTLGAVASLLLFWILKRDRAVT